MKTEPFAITAIASGSVKALGEYAMAEQIRRILMQEHDHQIDLFLATAPGVKIPDVSGGPKARTLRKRR